MKRSYLIIVLLIILVNIFFSNNAFSQTRPTNQVITNYGSIGTDSLIVDSLFGLTNKKIYLFDTLKGASITKKILIQDTLAGANTLKRVYGDTLDVKKLYVNGLPAGSSDSIKATNTIAKKVYVIDTLKGSTTTSKILIQDTLIGANAKKIIYIDTSSTKRGYFENINIATLDTSKKINIGSTIGTSNDLTWYAKDNNGQYNTFLIPRSASNNTVLSYGKSGFRILNNTNATPKMVITDTGTIGIGTATPDTNSILDIQSPNKGVILPRVALLSVYDTLKGKVDGTLLYNTASTTSGGDSAVTPGYYVSVSKKWQKIGSGSGSDSIKAANTVAKKVYAIDTLKGSTTTRDILLQDTLVGANALKRVYGDTLDIRKLYINGVAAGSADSIKASNTIAKKVYAIDTLKGSTTTSKILLQDTLVGANVQKVVYGDTFSLKTLYANKLSAIINLTNGYIPILNDSTSNGFNVNVSSMFDNTTYSGWKAFTRGTNGAWASKGQTTNYWVKIKLPEAISVWQVELQGRVGGTESPLAWSVLGSQDGVTYETIINKADGSSPLTVTSQFFAVPDNITKKYQYFQFLANTSNSGSTNPGISTFQLYRKDKIENLFSTMSSGSTDSIKANNTIAKKVYVLDTLKGTTTTSKILIQDTLAGANALKRVYGDTLDVKKLYVNGLPAGSSDSIKATNTIAKKVYVIDTLKGNTLNKKVLVGDTLTVQDGVYLPRVALTSTYDITKGVGAGLLVYNTATAGTVDTLLVTPGYYHHTGLRWNRITSGNGLTAATLQISRDTINKLGYLATKSDRVTVRPTGTGFSIRDNGTVGIGTVVSDTNSILDIQSPNKGVILPRVALLSVYDTLKGKVDGTLLYNTASTTSGGDSAVTPGYYVSVSKKWQKIGSGSGSDSIKASNTIAKKVYAIDTLKGSTTTRDILLQDTLVGANALKRVYGDTLDIRKLYINGVAAGSADSIKASNTIAKKVYAIDTLKGSTTTRDILLQDTLVGANVQKVVYGDTFSLKTLYANKLSAIINLTNGYIPILNDSTSNGFNVNVSSMFDNTTYSGWKAFTRGTNGAWASKGQTTNYWIKIKLPEAISVWQVELQGRADIVTSADKPLAWSVLGSQDGVTYETIINKADGSSPLTATSQFFTVPDNITKKYQYFQFFANTSTSGNPGLSTFQLYRKDKIENLFSTMSSGSTDSIKANNTIAKKVYVLDTLKGTTTTSKILIQDTLAGANTLKRVYGDTLDVKKLYVNGLPAGSSDSIKATNTIAKKVYVIDTLKGSTTTSKILIQDTLIGANAKKIIYIDTSSTKRGYFENINIATLDTSKKINIGSTIGTSNDLTWYAKDNNGQYNTFLIPRSASNNTVLSYGKSGFRILNNTNATPKMVITDTGTIGIGTATPDTNSILDIQSPNKGVILPRVALLSVYDTLKGKVDGTLLYNTASTTSGGDSAVTPGYYVSVSKKWQKIGSGSGSDSIKAANTVAKKVYAIDTLKGSTTTREILIQDTLVGANALKRVYGDTLDIRKLYINGVAAGSADSIKASNTIAKKVYAIDTLKGSTTTSKILLQDTLVGANVQKVVYGDTFSLKTLYANKLSAIINLTNGYIPILNDSTSNGFNVNVSSMFDNITYAGWRAFSRGTNGSWASKSQTTNFWIKIKLPEAISVWQVELQGRADAPERPNAWSVLGSQDGVTYETIINKADGSSPLTATSQFFTVPDNITKKYQYFQFFANTSTSGNPGLSTFQLYRKDKIENLFSTMSTGSTDSIKANNTIAKKVYVLDTLKGTTTTSKILIQDTLAGANTLKRVYGDTLDVKKLYVNGLPAGSSDSIKATNTIAKKVYVIDTLKGNTLNKKLLVGDTLTVQDGVYLPRVALTSTYDITKGVGAGLLVYNTATAGTVDTLLVTPGYYHHTGLRWNRITSGNGLTAATLQISRDTINKLGYLATKSDRVTVRPTGTGFSIRDNGTVGIGTVVSDTNSILDIQSPNKGVILPRVALLSVYDTLKGKVDGTLLYNTASTTSGGDSAVTPGYYVSVSKKWQKIGSGSGSDSIKAANTVAKKVYAIDTLKGSTTTRDILLQDTLVGANALKRVYGDTLDIRKLYINGVAAGSADSIKASNTIAKKVYAIDTLKGSTTTSKILLQDTLVGANAQKVVYGDTFSLKTLYANKLSAIINLTNGYIPILSDSTSNGFSVNVSSMFDNITYAGWRAFSRGTNGSWASKSQTTNFWIKIKLPEAISVWQVELQGRADAPERPNAWSVLGSQDGVTYETIINKADGSSPLTATSQFFTVPDNITKKYQYFQFLANTSTASSANPGISTFQLYRKDKIENLFSTMSSGSTDSIKANNTIAKKVYVLDTLKGTTTTSKILIQDTLAGANTLKRVYGDTLDVKKLYVNGLPAGSSDSIKATNTIAKKVYAIDTLKGSTTTREILIQDTLVGANAKKVIYGDTLSLRTLYINNNLGTVLYQNTNGYIPKLTDSTSNGFIVNVSSMFNNTTYSGWQAFTKNGSFSWASKGQINNYWIKIKLPEAISVWQVELLGRTDPTMVSDVDQANAWKVLASQDGVTYDTIIDKSDGSSPLGKTTKFISVPTTITKKYQYFQFYAINSIAGSTNPGLSTFQLYRQDTIKVASSYIDYIKPTANNTSNNIFIDTLTVKSIHSIGGVQQLTSSLLTDSIKALNAIVKKVYVIDVLKGATNTRKISFEDTLVGSNTLKRLYSDTMDVKTLYINGVPARNIDSIKAANTVAKKVYAIDTLKGSTTTNKILLQDTLVGANAKKVIYGDTLSLRTLYINNNLGTVLYQNTNGYIPKLTDSTSNGFIVNVSSMFNNTTYSGWQAFTKNGSFSWASKGQINNYWIKIKLPEAISVWQVELLGRTDPTMVSDVDQANAWKVLASQDGVTYDTIIDKSDGSSPLGKTTKFISVPTTITKKYQYFQFYAINSIAGSTNPGLSTFQLYRQDTIKVASSYIDYIKPTANNTSNNIFIDTLTVKSIHSIGGVQQLTSSLLTDSIKALNAIVKKVYVIDVLKGATSTRKISFEDTLVGSNALKRLYSDTMDVKTLYINGVPARNIDSIKAANTVAKKVYVIDTLKGTTTTRDILLQDTLVGANAKKVIYGDTLSLRTLYINNNLGTVLYQNTNGYIPKLTDSTSNGFTVNVSSMFNNTTYSGWQAFTKNGSFSWASKGQINNYWIKIKLPEAISVWQVELLGRTDPTMVSDVDQANAWKVLASQDGVTYDTIIDKSDGSSPLGKTTKFIQVPTTITKKYQYFQFYAINSIAGSTNPGLSTFQLYRQDTIKVASSYIDYIKPTANNTSNNIFIDTLTVKSIHSIGGVQQLTSSLLTDSIKALNAIVKKVYVIDVLKGATSTRKISFEDTLVGSNALKRLYSDTMDVKTLYINGVPAKTDSIKASNTIAKKVYAIDTLKGSTTTNKILLQDTLVGANVQKVVYGDTFSLKTLYANKLSAIINLTNGYIPILNDSTSNGFTVNVSSMFNNSSYSGWKAFTRGTNGGWATNAQTTNFWVKIKLPEAISVWQVELQGRADAPERPNAWSVLGSQDGVTYETIINKTDGSSPLTATSQFFPVPDNITKKYQYFQFYANTSTGGNPGLSTFQLYRKDKIENLFSTMSSGSTDSIKANNTLSKKIFALDTLKGSTTTREILLQDTLVGANAQKVVYGDTFSLKTLYANKLSAIINLTNGYIPILNDSTSNGFTVNVSSMYDILLYPGWKSFTKGTNGSWATKGQTTNFWVKIKLPEAISVWQVELQGRADAAERPNAWSVLGSQDGVTYETIINKTDGSSPLTATSQFFPVPDNISKKYQYFQFYANTSTGGNPGLSTFQLYRRDKIENLFTSLSSGITDSIKANNTLSKKIYVLDTLKGAIKSNEIMIQDTFAGANTLKRVYGDTFEIKTLYANKLSAIINVNTGYIPILTDSTSNGFTVNVSSMYDNTTYAGWKAFTRGTNGAWATKGQTTNYWVKIKLPEAISIWQVELQGRIGSPEQANAWSVLGSQDGVTYETIINKTDASSPLTATSQFFAVPSTITKKYQYFQFLATSSVSGSTNPGLSTFQLYRRDYIENLVSATSTSGNSSFLQATRMGINSAGNTSIPLVVGSAAANFTYTNPVSYLTPTTTSYSPSVLSYPTSIYANDNISGSGFIANSDVRIKNVLGLSDNKKDLETIKQIKITDYKFIDTISKGNNINKKVIAQEVKSIYPNAVGSMKGYIPNIYTKAEAINFNNNEATITLNKSKTLKVGDKLKVFNDKNEEFYPVVTKINSQNSVFVKGLEKTKFNNSIFVYGIEVDDFLSVDYDALTTLNISATQELIKKAESQEKRINKQEEEILELKKLIQEILKKTNSK